MTINELMEHGGVPGYLQTAARMKIRGMCPQALAAQLSFTVDRPAKRIVLEVDDPAVFDLISCEVESYVTPGPGGSDPDGGTESPAGSPGLAG